jgi:hypothetical protein
VEFYQNIGVIVLLFHKQIKGNDGRGQGYASGEQAAAALSPADKLTYQEVAVTANSTELVIEAGANELILVAG